MLIYFKDISIDIVLNLNASSFQGGKKIVAFND